MYDSEGGPRFNVDEGEVAAERKAELKAAAEKKQKEKKEQDQKKAA